MTQLTDDIVEPLFDEVIISMFQEPTLKYALTTDQKRRMIEALDTKVQLSEDDDFLEISMLFFKVTLKGNELSITYDADKLVEFRNKIPKK